VVVRLSNGTYRSLKFFWSVLSVDFCSVSWEPSSHDEVLFTDSSDFALGAHTGFV
jgi:hypothetical protein